MIDNVLTNHIVLLYKLLAIRSPLLNFVFGLLQRIVCNTLRALGDIPIAGSMSLPMLRASYARKWERTKGTRNLRSLFWTPNNCTITRVGLLPSGAWKVQTPMPRGRGPGGDDHGITAFKGA